MKQPEHLAGEAFKEARDKAAFLATQLTEAQKFQYETFVKAQEKEKEEQKQKAARAKAEFDQAKEKRPGAVKNYDPPIKIKDPYLRQMALNAVAQHHKVATLTLTQLDDKLRFLKKLEEQRIALTKEAEQQKAEQQQEKQAQFRDNAQRMTRSRASPEFARAAAPEQQDKTRQDFARAATAGKAKTDFQKAAKLDPAKQEAISRAIARVKEKEKDEEKERGREGRSEGRERGG